MDDEIQQQKRVAWVEREWLWYVVNYQHVPGAIVSTVNARFWTRRGAQVVADVLCGAHADGWDVGIEAGATRYDALVREMGDDGRMYRGIIADLKRRLAVSGDAPGVSHG
ncbi:hypothetical protein [Azospirillum canadense]|uniref:hypothetical protein n=1 Tax=Azospirillum canadense TaxID=403962 RepID=UPI00222800C4|nr:hypothetical protein [Azospirillum canadense]MCW2242212.1 hypothetical protein [Azospirillum canadense]